MKELAPCVQFSFVDAGTIPSAISVLYIHIRVYTYIYTYYNTFEYIRYYLCQFENLIENRRDAGYSHACALA